MASKKDSFEDAPFDEDAFCSRDKLEHTPPSAQLRTWHDTLLHDSIGPLSSTHIDSPVGASLNRDEINQVAVRLFPSDLSKQPSSQNTPCNSTDFQRKTETGSPLFGANTPSTICSEDDDAQRPTNDEGQKLGNKGHVHDMDEDDEAVQDRERERTIVSVADKEQEADDEDAEEDEEHIEEEDAEEGEETDKDEERIDVKKLDGVGTSRRLVGQQSSMTGLEERSSFVSHERNTDTATREGQGCDITSTGQGGTEDNDLELCVGDGIMTHLDKTLQFLRETETPRLPTRTSRATRHPQDAEGSSKASASVATGFRIDEDAKRPSLASSEPVFQLHHDEHSFGVGSSLPLDLNSTSQRRIIGITKTSESESPGVNTVSDMNAKFADSREVVNTGGMVQLEGFQTGVFSSDRATLPDKSLSLSFHSDVDTNDKSLNSSQKQRQLSYVAVDRRVSSSRFDRNSLNVSADLALQQEKVEELKEDDFDDVRRLLLETSLTAMTPNPRTSNRLSKSLSDHLVPSPITDAVHSTEVSFARLDDSTVNLLDFSDSILIPSSPANRIEGSVATGNLVDLS